MIPTSTPRAIALAASLFLAGGCSDPDSKAAKERIFSPEEPPRAKLAASQPIEVSRLATDPAVAHHVLSMSGAEAFERLGAYTYTATVSFEWSNRADSVELSETRSLKRASASDFHVKTENSRDNGLEILRLDGRTFARSRFHKFRERKRDRGQAELVCEDVFGALKTSQSLLNNRLGLKLVKQETANGRKVARFSVFVASKPLLPTTPDPRVLPPVKYPAGGPDTQTKKTLDFTNLRTPKSVDGTLLVDTETGVPLQATLNAKITVTGENKEVATLALRVKSELKPGRVDLAPPESFLPDEDRPDGVAAALKRFEIQSDGGVLEQKTSKPSEQEDE